MKEPEGKALRDVLMDFRQAALLIVDCIERFEDIVPRTSILRKIYKTKRFRGRMDEI